MGRLGDESIYLARRSRSARSCESESFLFLSQRERSRDAPGAKRSGCLSEANPKGRKGPRDAEILRYARPLSEAKPREPRSARPSPEGMPKQPQTAPVTNRAGAIEVPPRSCTTTLCVSAARRVTSPYRVIVTRRRHENRLRGTRKHRKSAATRK